MTRTPPPSLPDPPLYKTTRLDGTDFYSGTVDYAAALKFSTVIVHPRLRQGRARIDRQDPATYFGTATHPQDALELHGWPCRLFEVENVSPSRTVAGFLQNRQWRGSTRLQVKRELQAWQVFGPNGQDVARLIEALVHLNQAGRAVATRTRTRLAREAAWKQAMIQARRPTDRAQALMTAWICTMTHPDWQGIAAPPEAAHDALMASIYRDQLSATAYHVILAACQAGLDHDRHPAAGE